MAFTVEQRAEHRTRQKALAALRAFDESNGMPWSFEWNAPEEIAIQADCSAKEIKRIQNERARDLCGSMPHLLQVIKPKKAVKVPGTGKTLHLVDRLAHDPILRDRQVFVDGIPGLDQDAIPHTRLPFEGTLYDFELELDGTKKIDQLTGGYVRTGSSVGLCTALNWPQWIIQSARSLFFNRGAFRLCFSGVVLFFHKVTHGFCGKVKALKYLSGT